MAFKQDEVEKLLADTGRRCCLCGTLHKVQVHHITPLNEGGTDDIDNAIPLCPNCHDEVHGGPGYGRTTRTYLEAEHALVSANRETIARFEKKIHATLARVWGEDKPAAAGK